MVAFPPQKKITCDENQYYFMEYTCIVQQLRVCLIWRVFVPEKMTRKFKCNVQSTRSDIVKKKKKKEKTKFILLRIETTTLTSTTDVVVLYVFITLECRRTCIHLLSYYPSLFIRGSQKTETSSLHSVVIYS